MFATISESIQLFPHPPCELSTFLTRMFSLQADTLHSGEYDGDAIDEADERRNRRAMSLSFASNM